MAMREVKYVCEGTQFCYYCWLTYPVKDGEEDPMPPKWCPRWENWEADWYKVDCTEGDEDADRAERDLSDM